MIMTIMKMIAMAYLFGGLVVWRVERGELTYLNVVPM